MSTCLVDYIGVDLGGPKVPQPSLLLNKMFDTECKNVQNSNKIASNSLKMLEIVFRTIQNSTFSGGACPGKDHHRQPTRYPTLRPLLSKIPGSAPVTYLCKESAYITRKRTSYLGNNRNKYSTKYNRFI